MTLFKKYDPRVMDTVALGTDPYLDRLYGCFRVKTPGGSMADDRRSIELVVNSGQHAAVLVPDKMFIELPGGRKLADTQDLHIETLKDNLDTMFFLSMRSGWNQTEADIRRIVSLDEQGAFLATFKGEAFDIPAGTGTVTPLGINASWIGMILVHPEFRRQGIANAIMRKAVNYSLINKRHIIGLDATPMGKKVYAALGFVDSYRIWRSSFPLAQFKESGFDRDRVSLCGQGDEADIIQYDAVNFTERGNVFREFFKDTGVHCYSYRDDSGVIRGYCFASAGRLLPFIGPFYADSEQIAGELIVPVAQSLLAMGFSKAFIDVPENKFGDGGGDEKPSNHRMIREISCVRDFMRMYQAVDGNKICVRENAVGKSDLDPDLGNIFDIASEHYVEAVDFMERERSRAYSSCWGTSGPEKG